MTRFKLPAPGEGKRKRRASEYGKEGREVGGAARNNRPSISTRKKPTKRQREKQLAEVLDDLPEPGGHPADLIARAEAQGGSVAGRLTKLRDVARAALPADDGTGSIDPKVLDQIFSAREEKERLAPAPEKRVANAERVVSRTPMFHAERAAAASAKIVAQDARQLSFPGFAGATPTALVADGEANGAWKRKGLTAYTKRQLGEVVGMLGLPGVACNRCPAAEVCPEFKANTACAFDEQFAGLSARESENLLPVLETFADIQARRARRAVFLEERVTGGQLDVNVTRQIEVASAAAERVARIKQPEGPSRTLAVIATERGGEEGHEGGGLLARLLSGVTGKNEQRGGTLQLNPPLVTNGVVSSVAPDVAQSAEIIETRGETVAVQPARDDLIQPSTEEPQAESGA